MEEKDIDIKVGDIVQFTDKAVVTNGYARSEPRRLMGWLGMVVYTFHSISDERRGCCNILYGKEGYCCILDFESFNKLTDEQVANINLTDYFSEDDLKICRGYRDEGQVSTAIACDGVEIHIKKNNDALSYQVGGSHYKDKAIQPVQYIQANHLSFLEGCIVKRITRHRDKLKALDICKARQECDLILQLEYGTTFDDVMRQQEKSTKGE